MSTEYNNSREVPTDILCKRLRELSDAVTKGSVGQSEFTMRVPAECDRDADLVLYEAANRLEQLTTLQAEKENWERQARTMAKAADNEKANAKELQAEKKDLNIVIDRVTQFNQELIRDKERLEGELGRLTNPQPIETAPKDGSHFLIVYNDGEIRMGHYLDNSDKQYPWAGYRSFYGSVGITRKMVGWLPIPTQEPTNGS